jgi:hypothetical protein
MKKRLSRQEEFDIMKLVLDKFLWLGFGIMALGLYEVYSKTLIDGLWLMASGAFVLVVFIVILVREYEIAKA